jgi:hypothetical protein
MVRPLDKKVVGVFVRFRAPFTPALRCFCFVLLIFGWFYLTPLGTKPWGSILASSVGFLSNLFIGQKQVILTRLLMKKCGFIFTLGLSVVSSFASSIRYAGLAEFCLSR